MTEAEDHTGEGGIDIARDLGRLLNSGPALVVWRLIVAILGGYAFTSGYAAIVGTALPLVGVARADALVVAMITAFLVYATMILWAVATKHPWRFGGIVFAASLLMIIIAPRLAPPA